MEDLAEGSGAGGLLTWYVAAAMKQLLLASSSNLHGTGYLDHCAEAATDLFRAAGRVLFIPYALQDHDAYADKARMRLASMGLALDAIHLAPDPLEAIGEARGFFVGGGNTFRLLKALYDLALLEPIRERVAAGIPYMGTSAGSNVACMSIRTTNDMPIVYPPSFDALGLVPFNINPHYLPPDPASTHQGETRDQRIAEFHQENAEPVLGLKEGAMLRVAGSAAVLTGVRGARLFRRGVAPLDLEPPARLDFLLA